MENKVKYNLISSLLLILSSIYVFLQFNNAGIGMVLMIVGIWLVSYLFAGIFGLLNLGGKNRKLTVVSNIIVLVLTAFQFIAVIAFMVISKMKFTYLIVCVILLLALTGIGVFYAISELTNKKAFLIIVLGIIGFLLKAVEIVLFVVMARASSIMDFLRYNVTYFEIIGVWVLLFLGAMLFKLMASKENKKIK